MIIVYKKKTTATGRPTINPIIQICQTSAAEPIGIQYVTAIMAEVTEQAGLYHDNMPFKTQACRQLRLLIVNAVCYRLAQQQKMLFLPRLT